jgi:metal-responsive CopG/Arc/MetJ family transcriptional regulator
MSKEKIQDDKILLRLPSTLTAAVDQVLKEQLSTVVPNRSEFIRRAVRYTLDNIDAFKASEAATVAESQDVESVAKINAVRDSYTQLFQYKEQLMREPSTPTVQKQIAFLVFLIGEMIFKMNE